MVKSFVKNISIYVFSMISVLLYFKILAYYVEVEILAKYFKIKAFGMILYYCLSIRYSEFSYILKAQRNYSIFRMKNIYAVYSIFVVILSLTLLAIIYGLKIPFYLFIVSYLIFLLNDLLESYVAINRLYHRYLAIFNMKLILILKSVLFFMIFLYFNNTIDVESIFVFELCFNLLFAFIIVFFVLYGKNIRMLKLYISVFKNNLLNIKNTWLGSISKVPYEALPTYFLSFFVSNTLFVEYNVARKVYAMTNYANQPFMQILNTFSIDMKKDFTKYLKLYYAVIVTLNCLIALIIFYYGKEIITFLSNEVYATDHTISLVYIMFSVFCVYNLIYPFRQYVVLNKFIKFNNTAIIVSIMVMLGLTFSLIPQFKTYAISIIQPFGLILPIVLTFIILKRFKKNDNCNSSK